MATNPPMEYGPVKCSCGADAEVFLKKSGRYLCKDCSFEHLDQTQVPIGSGWDHGVETS